MLDIGWTELMVIGVVALIVVGPKDLPQMFRTVGQFVGRARKMARDFQRAMEDAADESGVRGMASDLRKATDPKKMGLDALDRWDKPKPNAAKAATAKTAGAGAGAAKAGAANTGASKTGASKTGTAATGAAGSVAGAAASTRTPDDPPAAAPLPSVAEPSPEELAELEDDDVAAPDDQRSGTGA